MRQIPDAQLGRILAIILCGQQEIPYFHQWGLYRSWRMAGVGHRDTFQRPVIQRIYHRTRSGNQQPLAVRNQHWRSYQRLGEL